MKTAFRTATPEVLEAWHAYEAAHAEVMDRRKEFGDRFGVTALMVRRSGFGHGTEIIGLPPTGEPPEGWVKRQHTNAFIPNTRRKAGKDLATEMASLRIKGIELPGMPPWHLGGGDLGMSTHAPALFEYEGVIFAGWNCALPEETRNATAEAGWEQIPLSVYYAAQEQHEATEVDV